MKARLLAGMGIVALVVSAALYAEDKKDPLAAAKCPVANKPVKADKTVDYKGGKVYFCCGNCPKAFDAAKHGTKANLQLVATGQAKQEKCVFTGGKLNPDTKITVSGAEVAFCCNNCKGKAEKASGDEQITLIFSDAAFAKGGFKVAEKKE
jgi:YHS domain-containing protein